MDLHALKASYSDAFAGGGIAISMDEQVFSTHTWNGHVNVVEALGVPESLGTSGSILYFKARGASEDEKNFVISADGDQSNKPIIVVISASVAGCPSGGN
jgi:hypothetical protein